MDTRDIHELIADSIQLGHEQAQAAHQLNHIGYAFIHDAGTRPNFLHPTIYPNYDDPDLQHRARLLTGRIVALTEIPQDPT